MAAPRMEARIGCLLKAAALEEPAEELLFSSHPGSFGALIHLVVVWKNRLVTYQETEMNRARNKEAFVRPEARPRGLHGCHLARSTGGSCEGAAPHTSNSGALHMCGRCSASAVRLALQLTGSMI